MAFENATHIDELDGSSPAGSDDPWGTNGIDEEFRQLKTVLTTDFGNISGAVTATDVELNYLDITTLGTVEASKALTASATSTITATGATWTDLGTVTTVTINGGTITGITDLAVADGGTGASDAATARTNLGIAVGTDVQAYDADLAAIAALTSAANKVIRYTGSGTADLLDFLDQNDMASDSATAVASQQSIKAYVDTEVAAVDSYFSLDHVITDVSTAETLYIPVPVTGTVIGVYTCLQGAISGADAAITLTQDDDSSMASITIAQSGSAAGDIDGDLSITNAAITQGDYLKLSTDGGSTGTVKVIVTIVVQTSTV